MRVGNGRDAILTLLGDGSESGTLLEEVYAGAPTVKTGRFSTTVNEFTDQIPALRAEVLAEATRRLLELSAFDADKILVEEDKGAILGGALCLATGLPLAVARWYTYDPGTSIAVPIESEYFGGKLYVNGIARGDRIIIVDDTISTGGTLASLIAAVQQAGAEVVEVVVAVEKVDNRGVERIRAQFGLPVRTVLKIAVDESTQRVRVLPSAVVDSQCAQAARS